MELERLTARATARAITSGELTALEVTEAALARAEKLGALVGAFARLTPQLAVADARRIDALVADRAVLPPLAGVPCPIKDLNPVAGVGWEAGSAAMAGNVAEVDDGIVGWFREAGTTLLGKTSTPEFGFPCYTEPEGSPPARTPWDLTRSAGGSSGGAAAAVAVGIVPIAHASDGGGSIRIPASACGLVGLKPTRGRISSGPLRPPGPGLATDGVLSRDVRDTALALDVLAGQRPGDIYAAAPPTGTFLDACDRELTGLRVGLLTAPVIAADADVHPACLDAAARAALLLEGLGHRVEEAPVPFPAERWQAFLALWSVGALGIDIPEDREHLLRPLTRWLREVGRRVSGVEYATAVASAQLLARDVAAAWDGFDVIVTPTLAQPPVRIGELRDDADPEGDFNAQTRFTPWTSVYNLSGRPAISLPLHTALMEGVRLPIGVMLGGRSGAEEALLSIAAALESVAPWEHPGLCLGSVG